MNSLSQEFSDVFQEYSVGKSWWSLGKAMDFVYDLDKSTGSGNRLHRGKALHGLTM